MKIENNTIIVEDDDLPINEKMTKLDCYGKGMIDPYDSDRKEYVSIYDGNQYITRVSMNYKDEYITTDKRIADIVISLLKTRNDRQWSMFSRIFGNPNNNRYEPRDIKLC